MARSMLQNKSLPKQFWAEVVNTVVYILNQSPMKAVLNKTPYEAWFNRKPNVDHFRVFGCIAYSQIPKENREKLDGKGEKWILIGYSNESKGYHLYNPKTKKMIVSRDVIFDEASKWSWPEDPTQQSTQEYPQIQGTREEAPFLLGPSSPTSPSLSGPSSSSSTLESSPTKPSQPTRRTQRERLPPSYLQDYECGHTITTFFYSEPRTFQEAAKDKKWIEVMDEEIKMIEKNCTWELVDKPHDKLVSSGSTRLNIMKMAPFKSTRLNWLPKGIHNSQELISMRPLHQ